MFPGPRVLLKWKIKRGFASSISRGRSAATTVRKDRTMPVVVARRLLNAKEAAAYLSISRSKLYQWTERGRIRSVRIDARRLFDVYDLDAFVESLKVNNAKKS